MTVLRTMPRIEATLNRESYEFLVDNWPELAEAIEEEVKSGAKPAEVGRFVMQKTNRERLAARSKQAAAHLAAVKGATQ
jgi:hypothetical protein